MTTSTQEFKNNNVTVTIAREPGCLVKFDILVAPIPTQAAYNEAVKVINKEISIPGFRKGRAPTAVIIQQFATHIDKEWEDILLNTAFKEAIALTDISPYNRESVNHVKVKNKSKEEGAQISLEFEAYPSIPEVNLDNFALNMVDPQPVKESQVEDVINDLRYNMADWEEITDRPLQEGDYVNLTIEKLDEPQEILCENTLFEAVPGKMAQWMLDLILGLTPGQSAEGISQKEPTEETGEKLEEEEEEKAFIPTNCRTTVVSIKKPLLPPVDEVLAKKAGATDAEDLLRKAYELLTSREKKAARTKMKLQIRDQLIENHAFDIPKSLLKGHRDQSEAERQYRMILLIQDYAEKNHIKVKNDEVYMEVLQRKWRQQAGIEEQSHYKDEEHEKTAVYTDMIANRVLEHIVDRLIAKNA